MQYGAISYVVPYSLYPKGYHCTPSEPLPFLSITEQKKSVNLYQYLIWVSMPIQNF